MIFQLVLNLHSKEKAQKRLAELAKEVQSCSGKVVGMETRSLSVQKNGMAKQVHLMGLLIDIPDKKGKQFMAFLKGNKISNKVHKKKTVSKSKTPTKKTKSSSKKSEKSKSSIKKKVEKAVKSAKRSASKTVKKVKKSKTPTKKSSKKDLMKKVEKDAKKLAKNMKKLEKAKAKK